MTPSSRKLGFSPERTSTVVPGRMCSSSPKDIALPSGPVTGTGAISPRNHPASRAAAALACEAALNSSSWPRVSFHWRAMSSAERPWGTRSGKRAASRGEVGPSPPARSEPIGMRVIDSTPPASPSSICPAITAWATSTTALSPLPQSRFTVLPGTEMGRPAARAAARATSKACSPTWVTQPRTTSSTRSGEMPVRASAASSTWAARSTAWTAARLPLRFPRGVRTASTMTAPGMRGSEPPVDPDVNAPGARPRKRGRPAAPPAARKADRSPAARAVRSSWIC